VVRAGGDSSRLQEIPKEALTSAVCAVRVAWLPLFAAMSCFFPPNANSKARVEHQN
jgi:hypothetical protein